MTAQPPIIVDLYAPLAHKQIIGPAGGRTQATRYTPSWVRPEDQRRLAAYLVRAAYGDNVSRWFLPDGTTQAEVDGHREYGDVGLLNRRVRAAVLGDTWTIVADGADGDPLAGPDIPERPEDPGEDADEIAKRIYRGRLAAWEREAEAAVTAWEQALETQPQARERQQQAREWATSHQLASRLLEAEDNAVGLGDGVLVFWPQTGDWPLITSHAPDSFFPDPPDDATHEFPPRVHLAWGYEDVVDGQKTRLVRRITWQMLDIARLRVTEDGWADLPDDEHHTSTGWIARRMPWHPEGTPVDDLPTRTCWFQDGVWRESDLLGRNEAHPDVDPFSAAPLYWVNPGQDLRLDTIPVVHLPNTPTGEEQFGQATIDTVAQVFDDVAQADGLTMSAASYIGDPTIGVSGVKVGDAGHVMPGRVFELGEKGRMDVLDLSGGVEKLMAFTEALQDRGWQNAGVPRELIGRGQVDGMSGVALALKLAPFAQLVAAMRIGREPKDRLIPRMAVKLAMIAEKIDPGPVGELRIQRGSFLPTDRAQTVEMVASALQAHAISLSTAVALLVAAGVPVDDAQAEIARIKAEWPGAAKDIADATGSEQLAADWLDVELPETAAGEAPVITLPPLGDQ